MSKKSDFFFFFSGNKTNTIRGSDTGFDVNGMAGIFEDFYNISNFVLFLFREPDRTF